MPLYTPAILLPIGYVHRNQEEHRHTGKQETQGSRKIGRNEKEVDGKNYVYRNHRCQKRHRCN